MRWTLLLLSLLALLLVAGLSLAQKTDADVTAETRRVFDAYREHHDTSYYAEDAIFIDMTNSYVVIEGRPAIAAFMGTHTGPPGDIPATGRTVEFPFSTSYWVENGEIVWAHLYYDSATMLRQLGLVE